MDGVSKEGGVDNGHTPFSSLHVLLTLWPVCVVGVCVGGV